MGWQEKNSIYWSNTETLSQLKFQHVLRDAIQENRQDSQGKV